MMLWMSVRSILASLIVTMTLTILVSIQRCLPNIGDPLEAFCEKEFETTKQPVVDFFNTLGDGHNVYIGLAPEKDLVVSTINKDKETYTDLFGTGDDTLASKLIGMGRGRILSFVVSFDERDASGEIVDAPTSSTAIASGFKGNINAGLKNIETFLNSDGILTTGFSCIAYVAGNNLVSTSTLNTANFLPDTEPTTANAERVCVYIGAQRSRLLDSKDELLTKTGTGFEQIGLHADIGVYVARTLARAVSISVGRVDAPFSLAGQALTNGSLVDNELVIRIKDKLSNYFNFPITHSLLDGYFFTSPLLLAGVTSDFSRVPEVRLLDYVIRALHLSTLAYVEVNIPIEGNSISAAWLSSVIDEISAAIAIAVDDGAAGQQVSNYSVVIPNNQNVLSTSELKINLEITPNGRATTVINDVFFTNPLS